MPTYVRDNLTDYLQDKFSFRTDYEIMTYEKFNKIFRQIKKLSCTQKNKSLQIQYLPGFAGYFYVTTVKDKII